MKKINLINLFLVAAMLISVGQALALPVQSGDSVYLKASSNYFSDKNNGNYDVYLKDGSSFAYSAFCVQKYTYFSPSDTSEHDYYATIDAEIEGFRAGSDNFDADGNLKYSTTLAAGTKYLFWNYSQGTLAGYDGSAADVSALQNAIWSLQGYDVDVEENEFIALVAGSVDASGLDVKVMNLWDSYSADGVYSGPHQSQLIAGAPVPEPATLILLGSGLAGLAFYRRKKK